MEELDLKKHDDSKNITFRRSNLGFLVKKEGDEKRKWVSYSNLSDFVNFNVMGVIGNAVNLLIAGEVTQCRIVREQNVEII